MELSMEEDEESLKLLIEFPLVTSMEVMVTPIKVLA
jgi:hypothetical protein